MWMEMKDRHMQRSLVNEWLFVGQNVEVFDGDDLVSHGDALMNSHKSADAMEKNPCVINGEDGQFVVVLVEHGFITTRKHGF